ncbi:TIGR00341 family protein [Candidatus Campbellbacteria bacterium CG11_big_fil_rev_8_21_14_0_20_44_21]|uniref:TIGR00341 family protein n=1 Tax=Candidatus Campbellbacteria bacterium CG22_combo_CG10-13_8_21_14_all_43_18 TaxID=1974530 RepID=A0A2H0DW64_9BACT|nr:MAG: TIGR00341 family protein [Candidatus Campbellbacteria bacterium CG22_combo_CG10-13_8_21_14_all_43_18]PIR24366.1 MAG: TIGR00341 family protein [Candidatus Campbellbacteria bacterium CG11_big_fil_rev_8_21_14_0_20_44_21]
MKWKFFNHLKEADKSEAVKALIDKSSPDQMFFVMVILSVLMATFGLLQDNAPVIIGSMMIAPVLYPILSLAMGFVMSDGNLIGRSFKTIVRSVLFALGASVFVTVFFSVGESINEEIILFARPSLISAAIAVVAGLAVAFSLTKKEINTTLPGVAISVSLVPPLAVVGIGIAKASWTLISSSLLLFIINILGIVFASMLLFSSMNFYSRRGEARRKLWEDNREIEKEKLVERE